MYNIGDYMGESMETASNSLLVISSISSFISNFTMKIIQSKLYNTKPYFFRSYARSARYMLKLEEIQMLSYPIRSLSERKCVDTSLSIDAKNTETMQ